MATINFTGAVDRDLLRPPQILAARTNTSVNALFNAELRYLVETFEAAEAGCNQNFQALLAFSLGQINDLDVKQQLGIDSDEDVFLLMTQAHLPMPRLPVATTRSMVESLRALNG